VSVRNSPAGETPVPEIMRFPFDQHGLELRLKDLENALLRSSVRTHRLMPSKKEQAVQSFGQELFSALIIGEVRSRYDASRGIAIAQRKGLRIKLRIQAPELNIVPWEFLYDPGEHQYISLSSKTPIVRYLNLPHPPPPMTVSPPLRILGMAVSPGGTAALEVEQEKKRMSEAILPLQESGMVELVWIAGQTWRDLQSKMQRGPWHVFHFIGHGGFDLEKKEGGIVLAGADGAAFVLYASRLGLFLGDHPSLRLVLLNSCEGAAGSSQDILSSTAAILMARGIPAVLAMQYEISDVAAIEFSQAFYGAIANGLAVDTAVTEGRKAIQVVGGNTVEWGTPVLCMRSPDGIIFEISQLDNEQRKRNKVSELLDDARAAWAREDWEVALRNLQSVLALEPGHSGASELLPRIKTEYEISLSYSEGRTRYKQHNWREALSFFQQVHERQPDYKDVNSLMVVCHKKLNQRAALVAWFRRTSASMRVIAQSAHRNRRRLLQAAVGLLIVGIAGVGVWWLRSEMVRRANLRVRVSEKKEEIAKKVNLTATELNEFKAAFEFVQLALSPDGKKLAYVGYANYGEVHSLEAPGSQIKLKEPGLKGFLACVAVTPDGETVAAGGVDGRIRLWHMGSETTPKIIQADTGKVFNLSFSKDGQSLVSASLDNDKRYKTVTIWRTENGDKLRQLERTGSSDTILAVNADKTLVAVQTANHELQLWSFSSGQGVNKTTIAGSSQAPAAALAANGQWLAVADKSGGIKVWRVADSNDVILVGDMKPRDLEVGALAFSSKGESLAAGWKDGTVTVWLQPFTDKAQSVSFQTKNSSVALVLDQSGETLAEGGSSLDQKGKAGAGDVAGHYSIRLWRIKKEIPK
jgi:WD40 repeat protein